MYNALDDHYVRESLEFSGERSKVVNATLSCEVNRCGYGLGMESGLFHLQSISISVDAAGQPQLPTESEIFSVTYA